MAWIVAVHIPGCKQIEGLRWNGEFAYYVASRGIEVFARRRDAEWALRNEFSIVADDWIKGLVSIAAEPITSFSIGVAVCKVGQRIADRTGYFPARREIPELIERVCKRSESKTVNRVRAVNSKGHGDRQVEMRKYVSSNFYFLCSQRDIRSNRINIG